MLLHNSLRALLGAMLTAALIAVITPTTIAVAAPSLTNLVVSANQDVTAIRQYYFCDTLACKAAKSAQSASALAGVKGLESLLKTVNSITVSRDEKGPLKNFGTDSAKMINAIGTIASQKTNTTKTLVVGIVYFESAYLLSDLYILGRELNHTLVNFRIWSTGVVAATQTLQIYFQLETPQATTNELIGCNQGLEFIAQVIETHLSSPVSTFNTQLMQLAQLLTSYSADSLHLLTVKATHAQKSALTVALRSFFAKFQSVTVLENRLAA